MPDEKPYAPQPGDEVVVVLEDWAKSHYRGRFVRIEPAQPEPAVSREGESSCPSV